MIFFRGDLVQFTQNPGTVGAWRYKGRENEDTGGCTNGSSGVSRVQTSVHQSGTRIVDSNVLDTILKNNPTLVWRQIHKVCLIPSFQKYMYIRNMLMFGKYIIHL